MQKTNIYCIYISEHNYPPKYPAGYATASQCNFKEQLQIEAQPKNSENGQGCKSALSAVHNPLIHK